MKSVLPLERKAYVNSLGVPWGGSLPPFPCMGWNEPITEQYRSTIPLLRSLRLIPPLAMPSRREKYRFYPEYGITWTVPIHCISCWESVCEAFKVLLCWSRTKRKQENINCNYSVLRGFLIKVVCLKIYKKLDKNWTTIGKHYNSII